MLETHLGDIDLSGGGGAVVSGHQVDGKGHYSHKADHN